MDMLDNISKMIKIIPIVNRLLDKVITNIFKNDVAFACTDYWEEPGCCQQEDTAYCHDTHDPPRFPPYPQSYYGTQQYQCCSSWGGPPTCIPMGACGTGGNNPCTGWSCK